MIVILSHRSLDEFFLGTGDINAAFLPKNKILGLPSPDTSAISGTSPSDVEEQLISTEFNFAASIDVPAEALNSSLLESTNLQESGHEIDDLAVLKNDDRELDRLFTVSLFFLL